MLKNPHFIHSCKGDATNNHFKTENNQFSENFRGPIKEQMNLMNFVDAFAGELPDDVMSVSIYANSNITKFTAKDRERRFNSLRSQ